MLLLWLIRWMCLGWLTFQCVANLWYDSYDVHYLSQGRYVMPGIWLTVCYSVCLLATLRNKYPTNTSSCILHHRCICWWLLRRNWLNFGSHLPHDLHPEICLKDCSKLRGHFPQFGWNIWTVWSELHENFIIHIVLNNEIWYILQVIRDPYWESISASVLPICTVHKDQICLGRGLCSPSVLVVTVSSVSGLVVRRS